MTISVRPLTGIACAIIGVACFSSADVLTRQFAPLVGVVMAMWIRHLIQISMAIALAPQHLRKPVFDRIFLLQLLRGALQLSGGTLGFLSLRYLQVGEFSAILMLTPFVLTGAVALLFGEHVSWPRWGLVTLAMFGALLVVWPGKAAFSWYLVFPFTLVLSSAAFYPPASQ